MTIITDLVPHSQDGRSFRLECIDLPTDVRYITLWLRHHITMIRIGPVLVDHRADNDTVRATRMGPGCIDVICREELMLGIWDVWLDIVDTDDNVAHSTCIHHTIAARQAIR